MSKKPDEGRLRAILEKMRAAGEKITVDTFITAAGGGDRTAMSQFLAKWRKEIEDREGARLPELPASARDLLAGLDLGLREVFGTEQARERDRQRIVDTELRVREAATAAAAAATIGSLETERATLLEQISQQNAGMVDQRQRVREGALQIERLRTKLDAAEQAGQQERASFAAILHRQEVEQAFTRDQLRSAEAARSRAEDEREALQLGLVAREQELLTSREQLQQAEVREAALTKENEALVASVRDYEQKVQELTLACKEERAARAELARKLRQCRTEGGGVSE